MNVKKKPFTTADFENRTEKRVRRVQRASAVGSGRNDVNRRHCELVKPSKDTQDVILQNA